MPKNNKKKIMCVDDAQFTRNILKKIINKTDFSEVVAEAGDGEEAIKKYQEVQPDLVTMDLVMPVKGGIETIEELLQLDENAKIIVVSALGQEALVLEAAKKGAKDFIQKPFKNEQVLEVLERTLLNNK
ncbi:MAG: response regulator [Candidatus Lokiarchaeota archaeon]|jgi:two-component system chemotaxis response regulator CheY|nr:response regulator [Candidatus Lokiarchaeota archaeon]TXT66547.1 MAG: Chemotaxis protein CheY [Candidatus Lokiarchaeota archaeon]